MASTAVANDALQGIVGRVVTFVTGNSPKDKLAPKKAALTSKAKATTAAAGGEDGTRPIDKISKPKRPTLGARELSRKLGLSLPLHVAARACQNDMERLAPQTIGPRRSVAIHGRASAVTTVAAIEYMAKKVYQSAIAHARKRGAGTVSLLDIQRGIIVNPRLARSLRYSRVAVSKSANPLGIVPGMMIGIKHKKKKHHGGGDSRATAPSTNKKTAKATPTTAQKSKRPAVHVSPTNDVPNSSDSTESDEPEGDAVDF